MDDKKVSIEFAPRTILWVLATILSLWLLIALKDVILTVVLSLILATAISPLVSYFQKKKVPRTLSAAGVILATIGILFLVVRLIVPPFANELSNIVANRAEYVTKIAGYFQNFSPAIKENINSTLNNFLGSFGGLDFGGLVNGAKGFLNGLVEVILVFVLCFYLLQQDRGVEGAVVAYVPKQHQKRVLSIYRKISNKMTQWMRSQILLSVIIFFVNLVGLSLLGVHYALTLAIVSGIVEFLPYIGAIISCGLAVTIALTQSPVLALIVLGWFLLIHQLEGHFIIPQVMKKSLGLNPIAVILAVIIGGKLLGFIGILISVPVAAAIGVLLEEFVKKQEMEAN